ncbi:hypothetical protein V8E51_003051 [Hyaloscypha variabilis]
MIKVFVCEAKETFAVHKTLLMLHSGLVRQYLSDGQGEDGKLTLIHIKPAMFADFVCWMYNGTYLQDAQQVKAPGFQNFCMDDYQTREHKVWNDLLDRCPELVKDMALMAKAWNGTVAWDDVNRHYMAEEGSLDELWEDIILMARSKGDAAKAAVNGCHKSKIELAHLNRHTAEDVTVKDKER